MKKKTNTTENQLWNSIDTLLYNNKNKIIQYFKYFQYTYNPKMRNKKYVSSMSNFEKLINIMRADIVCTHKPG